LVHGFGHGYAGRQSDLVAHPPSASKEIVITNPTVVLVHGAFADASGWGDIIRELESGGVTVFAPPNPLRGIAADAEGVRAFVAAIDGPVVLVGHSYGGAVITAASSDLANVSGLVYLAAFGLDEGESLLSVQEPFSPSLLPTSVRPTSYPAPGAAGGPDLYIGREVFRETFCADLPTDRADVLFATQRPVAAAALGEPLAVKPGWKSKPSWFLVSEHDQAINPEVESFMAERMGATTARIDGSHIAFVSRPVAVAAFIASAVAKLA
jgi:pimeloyl-ACP methyl ester carboxylesterase